VFNPSGWIEPRQHPENDDLYLFAYGHDYPGCLADFYRVSGPVPLVPRWILGNWWSRYWTYSADELLGLMEAFKAHEVPISVCIVDMDWHLTETGNASSGWTGYTWNRALFPDPPDFLAKLHGLGLRTALNLHPADGVWPHEEQYADFARQMGIDPETKEPVPFDCSDRRFMDNYFKLLHHPYEAMGIDFWWLDWQQGKQTKIPGLDPLWWLNHLHYYDYGRDGKRRPFIFSRWGGLGNHRYPIGFSGDTVVGWDALEFQPPFTATAANVGYGWWSHDIGGHMGGIEDDECYTRWVQYGVFSPILRLHSTNNSFHERRPWRRGPAAEKTASAAMRLRHRLIPYLYSMAWRNHYGGLPLVTPMYYTHPEEESAYQCYQQYWFGSELMVAPFTSPANAETKLSAQHVWFPDGVWFDFFSGQAIPGGRWRTVYGTLDDIPVFARSGAIVPLAPEVGWRGVENPQELHLHIFPGASNRFVLYEDDGATTHYLQGAYALTAFELEWKPDLLCFTIQPAQGDRKVILQQRTYHLYLRGVVQPEAIRLQVNGAPIEANWDYQTQSETLTISPLAIQAGDVLQLEVSAPALTAPRDRSGEILRQWLSGFRLDSWVKQEIAQKWPQVQAGEVSLRSFRKLSDAQRSALESLGEV
ncbi:MAG: DUF5110 domain-containing protein, partial [Anaerolineales bacterium]|nr:DUF5110 domain-containing protein [Anaerolineales bacterium]